MLCLLGVNLLACWRFFFHPRNRVNIISPHQNFTSTVIVGSLRWEPTVGPVGPSRWKQVKFMKQDKFIQTIKTSYFHHSTTTIPPKCSLICLKIEAYMHIYPPRSSVFNISFICVRVTLIRWFRSMLFRLHFHQVRPSDPSSSDFHQVHDPPIQVNVFGILHTDGKISFMSAGVCEIGTKTWSVFDVLIKSSHFHQVHDSPIHYLLILIKSTTPRFIQVTVFGISHTDRSFFFLMSAGVCEIDNQWWS
jgi:hypothetical protein